MRQLGENHLLGCSTLSDPEACESICHNQERSLDIKVWLRLPPESDIVMRTADVQFETD